MDYLQLPGENAAVSVVGLGTWVFGGEYWGGADDAAARQAVDTALDCGINLIDTAPFYSDGKSEILVGQAIRGRRDRVFISTKCGLVRENGRIRHDLTPASISLELDRSLKNLDCGLIDLYQIHWPDPGVPLERALETLVYHQQKGRIRYIGVCNLSLEELRQAVRWAPVKTLQVQYSLLERGPEKELLEFCRNNRIGVLVYGALAGGVLSGKYSIAPNLPRSDVRRRFYRYYEGCLFEKALYAVDVLRRYKSEINQAAINWARSAPGVLSVLAGSRNPDQVRMNAASVRWNMDSMTRENISCAMAGWEKSCE